MNAKSTPSAAGKGGSGKMGDRASSDGARPGTISGEGVRRDRPSDATLTSESAGASEATSGDESFESWLEDAARVAPPSRAILPAVDQVVAGKYRIESELGRGGMGAVYQAVHTVSHKPVALKWMLRSGLDARAKERFTREARAAGRISHPNVVDVYDIGEEGDAAFLVMELLRGESLRRRMTKGPLGVAETADLLVPAMRGVAAAHEQGVIHRDLKPDNIFLCAAPDGAPREAKVLDFGVSTITSPVEGSESTLTQEGVVLGTPAYMSAEQLENPRTVDVRADVHALGVILYEVLTGRLPFEASSHNALVLAIAKNAPAPPRTYREDLPEELQDVMLRALGPERFANVDEFIEALLPFGSAASRETSVLPAAPSKSPPRLGFRVVLGLVALAGAAALWFATRDASDPEPNDRAKLSGAPPSQAAQLEPQEPDAARVGAHNQERTETQAAGATPASEPAVQQGPAASGVPLASKASLASKVPLPLPRAVPPKRAPRKKTSHVPVKGEAASATEKGSPGRSGTISPDDL